MIIGNGQLAQSFIPCDEDNVVFFASGVSDSNCTDPEEFERERNLLLNTLQNNNNKKIVYFSSCALSSDSYEKNLYYQHKKNMEELIKAVSNSYYIFRIPQLFGKLKHHKTLINFLYESILFQKQFKIYTEAYRYVIEINDVRKLVKLYINIHNGNSVLDLANPYRYKVTDIVQVFEEILGKQALYELVEKKDGYYLDLTPLEFFINTYDIKINFGSDYLYNKLSEKLNN